jgi:Domain of unknown function (DUF4124)
MLRRVPFIALFLAGTCTLAQADVYRWVDEAGVPHYSDQWVPGSQVIKTAKLHPRSESASRPSDQKSLTASNERVSAQLADQANARSVQQDVARTRDAQCKKAQQVYAAAITHRRVYKTDATGERNYLSDADIDAYRTQTRKEVQDACGSVPKFDPDAPIPEPQPIEPKPIPEPKVNPAAATSP